MQRQSVPLIRASKPLVSTGLEERVVRDSGKAIMAAEDGVVAEVDAQHILIKSQKPKAKSQNHKLKPKIFNFYFSFFVFCFVFSIAQVDGQAINPYTE